jgi:5-methylcytosine-specific restriction endonuclease McrA
MSRGQKKIRGLFQEASRLLRQVRPESRELFVCPLCLREFTIEATGGDRLSVEHVIPSALGGKVETLTCTECNNAQGSTLDSHVVKAMEALDGLSGKGTVRV